MTVAFRLDEQLAAFVVQGNALYIGTRNAALEPTVVRLGGIRLLAPDRVAVLLPHAVGEPTRANLEANGEVALSISRPTDYQTVQLKGRFLGLAEPTPDDIAAAQEQFQVFAASIEPHGFTRQQARNLWLFTGWRVDVQLTSGYGQTPGPGAGAPLGAGR